MRFLVTFLFGLCLSSTLYSQRTLSGIVLDANSGAPLPSVNVFLKNNQTRGVLTNDLGEYSIRLTDEELKGELMFSLLSYRTHSEPIWRLDTSNLFFNLRMETSFVSLGEVVVISDLGLKQLVQKCLDNVSKVYGQEDYLLRAYVRVYDIDSDTFSRQLEAQINIRDTKWPPPAHLKAQGRKGFAKSKITQFRMPEFNGYSLRDRWDVLNSQNIIECGYQNWVNKLRSRHPLKVLRGQEENMLDILTFSNRGEYLNGTDTLIKIHYRLTDEEAEAQNIPSSTIEYWYSGDLLVNKSDLAIMKIIEGRANENGEEKFYRSASYQKVNGKYYVKELREVMAFDYDQKSATYYSNRLLYVTEVIADPKAIKAAFKGKVIDYGLKLKDIRVKYDVDFWADNSMLKLSSAPEVMRANLKRMQELKEGKID